MEKGLNYINGAWKEGSGAKFNSLNPATSEVIWQGKSATESDVDEAAKAARTAFHSWGITTLEERMPFMEKFHAAVDARKADLSKTLAMETGKTLWDATTEIGAMIGKLKFSLQAYHERTGIKFTDAAGFKTALRHKPHGVLAVYGPYNFPAHLPNGHIMPALIAGNTIIFKPSELTPLTAQKMVECWHEAGLPKGVVNLVQGERDTGKFLSQHKELDGLLFTGSSAVGKILHEQFAEAPHKILALELGGNSPLVVHEVGDVKAAAYWTIQSAYMTTGQRCTCARRLIVPKGKANDAFIATLIEMVKSITIGAYSDTPEPFMGPLINNNEAEKLLQAQADFKKMGGKILIEMQRLKPNLPFVSPSLIDVTKIKNRPDKEWFGPLLQLIRVENMEEALKVANDTQYGLSSGIFTDKREHYDYFLKHIRAGVANWNRPTTGSSGNLPFGGVGLSGDHRPAAYYAADYCAYPVASNEAEKIVLPAAVSPGLKV